MHAHVLGRGQVLLAAILHDCQCHPALETSVHLNDAKLVTLSPFPPPSYRRMHAHVCVDSGF